MSVVLLIYLGGVLTILSPCILPVLPFVFARAEQRFLTNGLPLLAGMAVTFAGIATLAAVGGAWAVRLNQYGRVFALILMAAFALTLLSRRLADWMARPFVALGNRLTQPAAGGAANLGPLHSLLLGVATGLLWAPCAGPILGLVLTGAAISGPNTRTTLLLFSYAAGAATSLAIAILAGGRLFSFLKKSLGAGEWVRRALGIAVLAAVLAILLGWDSSVLTRWSIGGTNRLESSLVEKIKPHSAPRRALQNSAALPIEGELPSLKGATAWLNSPPLSAEQLRGKVVLVDFWTYSCINCLRALPYVREWYAKYKDHGLIVIGVHAPEFAFEKDEGNVRRAVADLHVAYPVALDNNYAIWQGFSNEYWPAHYFIDAQGLIRAHHFGEGDYAESENTIRQLLSEAGYRDLPPAATDAAHGAGVQAAADAAHNRSPETYIGYRRAENFSSAGGIAQDRPKNYSVPRSISLNQWGLDGSWSVDAEKAVLQAVPGKIQFRFFARDLHLVLGPGPSSKPVRFRVLLDGAAPKTSHGADIDADGQGAVTEQRLYQLIRQSGDVQEHEFSIEFLDPAVQAYAFTFG
jgi:cytochrome c biogenesis protein CcdA/thiol-disulfide isomerase/thioredoxin